MPKHKSVRQRAVEALLFLSDRIERLGGMRFYKLHLEAAARWHKRGMDTIEIEVGGKRLIFRLSSAKAARRIETLLTKEPGTIAWVDSFAPEDIFWDIGANIGIYSLYAAKVSGGRTLAFEPASFNHALLCDNIRLNRLDDRVDAYGIAFADRTQIGHLTFTDDAPGAAFATVASDHSDGQHEGAIVFSIDEFIERFTPPFPNHIKIDVDGFEEQVLAGAARTVADPRLRSLSIEVDEDDLERPKRVDSFLGAAGLRFMDAQRSPLAPHSASSNRRYQRD